MQIEKMTATVRPRSTWEAIDLGFTMARAWFLPLWGIWLMCALPVFALTQGLLYNSPYLCVFLVWWLKPIYELPLLFYCSRALFGEYPKLSEVRKQLPSILLPQLIPNITLRRIFPSRAFNYPVALLEGLKGDNYKQRVDTLHTTYNSNAAWLTIGGYHIEMIFWMGCIALLALLIPADLVEFQVTDVMSYDTAFAGFVSNLLYFICMSLMAPFYVAAGFALYLTRRTQLEGWDIELNFKRIQQRLDKRHSLPALLLAGLLCLNLPAQEAQALEPEAAKSEIEEITDSSVFGELKTRSEWQPLNSEETDSNWWKRFWEWLKELLDASPEQDDSSSWSLPFLGQILQAILWGSAIALVLYLIFRFTNWLEWTGISVDKTPRKKAKPTELFGLDLTQDNLPDAPAQHALQLMREGKLREALSLLYRGSLTHLVHIHELEIDSTHTEGECLRLVQRQRPNDEAAFFQRLTNTWLHLAYAHELPSSREVEALCQEWPAFYEPSATGGAHG